MKASAATWCSVLDARPRDARAEAIERVREAIAVLGEAASPGARAVGEALRLHLEDGRALDAALGLKVGRGRAHDRPHRVIARQRQLVALQAIASSLPGDGVTARARELARLIVAGSPLVASLHTEAGPPPASVPALVRLLREVDSRNRDSSIRRSSL